MTATHTTASIAPTANALVLAWVLTGSVTQTPSLSGNGLTWVSVAQIDFASIASPVERFTLFRTMGAAPSAGAVTISYGGSVRARWSISEFVGVVTTGTNGSGAVVQSKTNRLDSGPTSWTTTLDGAPAAGNATAAGHGLAALSSFTPEAGWAELGDVNTGAAPNRTIQSQWSVTGDASAGVSAGVTQSWAAIMVEVAALAVAGAAESGTRLNRGLNAPPIQAGLN